MSCRAGLLTALIWPLAGALPGGMPSASAAEAAMTVQVPAGQIRSLRLRNLPKDASVAVSVRADGKLGVSFVSEQDYRRFPQVENPVFLGSVERRLSFAVAIPESGHYFLVFDNRPGTQTQKVQFAVKAERAGAAVQK